MSKHAVGYESYLHDFKDGSIWLLKDDALRLGAGYLPVHDDKTMTNKLWAPNEQAELNLRTLLAINDDRLTIERPRTHFVERLGTFDGDGFTYVEAVGFLNWLAQYITQTQAEEIPFPNELARAVKRANGGASLHHHPTDETFEDLTLALDGQFDKPLEELPEALRQRVVREFFMVRWNAITADQRRCHAQNLDNRNNPDKEPERHEWQNYFSPLFTRLGEAKKELARMEATDARTPSEEKLKTSEIKKLQEEIDHINESIKAPPSLVPVAGRQSAGPVLIGSTYYTERKGIMAALGVTWNTVKRYMKTGLVVTHNPAGKPQTTQEEIDRWRASGGPRRKK